MGLITKDNTFSAGAVIVASEHNANFNTIYNSYNGNISNANVASNAAIALSKLSLSDDVAFTGDVNFTSSATTDDAIDVTANSLTTGSMLDMISNSTDTSARDLVSIKNDNTAAVGAIPLKITQDAANEAMSIACASGTAGGEHIIFTGDPTPSSPTDGGVWYDGTYLNLYNGTNTLKLNDTVSVQRGVASLLSGTSSMPITINAVVPANSEVKWLGCATATYTGAVTLTNSTTVTIDLVDNSDTRKVSWEVVEHIQ